MEIAVALYPKMVSKELNIVLMARLDQKCRKTLNKVTSMSIVGSQKCLQPRLHQEVIELNIFLWLILGI